MTISLKVHMDKKQWDSIESYLKTNRKHMKLAIRKGLAVLHTQIRENLSGPSHTLFPDNGNPFPGTLTGRMKNSINAKIVSGRDFIIGKVGPNVDYAVKHEYGFGVPKRPYLGPALKRQRKRIRQLFQEGIRASLRKR